MRWAIITGMYNVADLAVEFCRYHLSLGVDKIFVSEYGSEDETLELLQSFVAAGRVQLIPLPTHRFVDYDPSNALLQRVREEKAADWISFLDPDEFLVGPPDLRKTVERDWRAGLEAVAIPRFNLTAIGPIPKRTHYFTHLNLKIVATDVRSASSAAPLSSPWIFSRLPPKVMMRSQSNLRVATGDHDVVGANTTVIPSADLEILHLPLRGYGSFQRKVADTEKYLAANPEFRPGIGWHWRRWIKLGQAGQLEDEYAAQFLDPQTAATLLEEAKLVEEERLANWLRRHQGSGLTNSLG